MAISFERIQQNEKLSVIISFTNTLIGPASPDFPISMPAHHWFRHLQSPDKEYEGRLTEDEEKPP